MIFFYIEYPSFLTIYLFKCQIIKLEKLLVNLLYDIKQEQLNLYF